MDIKTVVDLFTDDAQKIELYDIDKDKSVFTGTVEDWNESWYTSNRWEDYEVGSIDTLFNKTDIITINITKE